MNGEAKSLGNGDHAPAVLHQELRDQLVVRLAIGAVALHLLAGLLVVAWVWIIVPAAVTIAIGMNHVGDMHSIPQSILMASKIHEICKQFRYVLLVLAVALAVVDYLVVAWLTSRLGLKWGASFVAAVFLGIILNLYLTHSMLLVQPIQQAIDETKTGSPA